jgi:rubrerythrin
MDPGLNAFQFYSSMFPNISENRLIELLGSTMNKSTDEVLRILENENSFNLAQNNFNRQQLKIVIPQLDYEPVEKFTHPCKKMNCKRQGCFYYHCPKERRRAFDKCLYIYESKPCFNVFTHNNEWLDPNVCSKGNGCGFCHTENELKYYVNPKMPVMVSIKKDLKLPTPGDPKYERKIDASLIRDKDLMVLHERTQKLLKEISAKDKDKDIKAGQIPKLNQSIEEYKKYIRCVSCQEGEMLFINIPCSHTVCERCKNDDICPKCGSNATVFQVHLGKP